MSLTTTLLRKLKIQLPVGNLRSISNDDCHCAQQTSATRNEKTRAANIEVVFSSVAAGAETISAITDHSGLSELTVKKALNELEDKDRITRDSSRPKHSFTVKTKETP